MRLLTFVALTLVSLAFIQAEGPRIYWSENRSLRWSDFQAKAPASAQRSIFKAESQTGITTSVTLQKDSLQVSIQAYFDKANSWKVEESDYLLNHEQMHFNITELYARKFRQQIHQHTFQLKTTQADLNKIYAGINTESAAMQKEYDQQTMHSLNHKEQESWNKRIRKELDALKAYTSESVNAPLKR